jgi:hypothetical protein
MLLQAEVSHEAANGPYKAYRRFSSIFMADGPQATLGFTIPQRWLLPHHARCHLHKGRTRTRAQLPAASTKVKRDTARPCLIHRDRRHPGTSIFAQLEGAAARGGGEIGSCTFFRQFKKRLARPLLPALDGKFPAVAVKIVKP